FFHGLLDALRIFLDTVNEGPSRNNEQAKLTLLEADDLRKELETLCVSPPATLSAARLCLEQLVANTARIAASVQRPESQEQWWGDALTRQCQAALEDLIFLAPWTVVAHLQDEQSVFPLDKVPTLRELAALDLESPSGIQDPRPAGPVPGQWLNEWRPFI